jgi:carboxyl-terminal processing protease
VNTATIGPAEAVAGVLKDFHRAKVVGLGTPGLVARTEYVPVDDGTSVLITSGVFCLRSGVQLWGQGVEPDSKIEDVDAGLDEYLDKTRSLLPTAD